MNSIEGDVLTDVSEVDTDPYDFVRILNTNHNVMPHNTTASDACGQCFTIHATTQRECE